MTNDTFEGVFILVVLAVFLGDNQNFRSILSSVIAGVRATPFVSVRNPVKLFFSTQSAKGRGAFSEPIGEAPRGRR